MLLDHVSFSPNVAAESAAQRRYSFLSSLSCADFLDADGRSRFSSRARRAKKGSLLIVSLTGLLWGAGRRNPSSCRRAPSNTGTSMNLRRGWSRRQPPEALVQSRREGLSRLQASPAATHDGPHLRCRLALVQDLHPTPQSPSQIDPKFPNSP